jgi:ABC-type multidrug transport system ATPase subunit
MHHGVLFSTKFQSNILVSQNGDALLSDFGLARLRHDRTRTLSRGNEAKLAVLSP